MLLINSKLFLGITLALVLTASSMTVTYGAFVGSPTQQLEYGITPEYVACNDNRVLALRTNGEHVCVKIGTSELLDWKTIRIQSTDPSPSSPFAANLVIDSVPNLCETANVILSFDNEYGFNHGTIEKFPALIRLPDGLRLVSGDLETIHFWQNGDTVKAAVKVQAVKTGHWTIQGIGFGGATDLLHIVIDEGSYISENNLIHPSSFELIPWNFGIPTADASFGNPFVADLTIDSAPNLCETANVTLSVARDRPYYDIEQLNTLIRLPDGLKLVSGELDTNHFWQSGDTVEVTVTVQAIQTGNWTITGLGHTAVDRLNLVIDEDSSYIQEGNFKTPPRTSFQINPADITIGDADDPIWDSYTSSPLPSGYLSNFDESQTMPSPSVSIYDYSQLQDIINQRAAAAAAAAAALSARNNTLLYNNELLHPNNPLMTLSNATITPADSSRGCKPNCFIPNLTVVNPGNTVTFSNTDNVPHTFSSGSPFGGPDNVWNSGLVFPGENFTTTLQTPGTFEYFSITDPWMQGKVIVNPYALPPTANPATISTIRNASTSITLTASDPDFTAGDILDFFIVTHPTGGSIDSISRVPNTTPISSTIKYTSFSSFTGTDTFQFNVRDASGIFSDTVTVTIDVSVPDLTRPTANSQFTSVIENQVIQLILTGFDPEDDPLTFIILPGPPAFGTISPVISFSDNAAFITYTPNANFTGIDALSFRVSDGSQTSDVADVAITTIPYINTAPIAINDIVTVIEDSGDNILNVLINDIDVDVATQNDSLLISSFDDSNIIGGTLTVSPDNLTMLFTPSLNFDGSTFFTYVAKDSKGALSPTATVTIKIDPQFDSPITVNDFVTVELNSTGNIIDVLSNDSDPDTGDILNVAFINNDGTRGTATIFGSAGFAVEFTPETNFIGDTSFSYTATDLSDNPTIAQVNVSINAFDE